MWRAISEPTAGTGITPRVRGAANPPDAGNLRFDCGFRLVSPVRGRRIGRSDGETCVGHVRTGQAGDVEGQTRAGVRLRSGRFSMAQKWREYRRRIAAARTFRRFQRAPARGRLRHFHAGETPGTGGISGALSRRRARQSPLEGLGRARIRGGRRTSDAGRPEPVESREGSIVGAIATRTGRGSRVRTHAGFAFSAHVPVSRMAHRQKTGRLYLRPA